MADAAAHAVLNQWFAKLGECIARRAAAVVPQDVVAMQLGYRLAMDPALFYVEDFRKQLKPFFMLMHDDGIMDEVASDIGKDPAFVAKLSTMRLLGGMPGRQ
jgi:predicted NBD/HSP70 family sugar kinase